MARTGWPRYKFDVTSLYADLKTTNSNIKKNFIGAAYEKKMIFLNNLKNLAAPMFL